MKKIVKIGAVVLSLGLIFGIGCNVYNVYAQGRYTWSDSQIEAEYELFSEFAVPKRNLIINGEKIVAETVVTTPDGTATKADVVELDTAGKYIVTYTASMDGKHYVEEESFIVNYNLYSFTTENSSAKWGKYQYAKDTEGLMIRLAEGDKFTLSQPINIANLGESEVLLQAFATPDTIGQADFQKLCFKFTDVNDPDISLYISARQADWDETLPYTYYVAGGNDQTPKGFEASRSKVHEEGKYGASGLHGFGLGNELCAEYCDEQAMNFRVDFSTMMVYSGDTMIIDLDSAEYFDTIWEGFSSDQVFLTIWAEYYSGQTANFCLSKVAGVDLKQEEVVDAQPPVITIDTEYDQVPSAVMGGTYQYIPEASAKDLYSGECEVITKVYYNYQSPNSTLLQVKDGTFATERYGYYAIVYEATDDFGNLGREIIWVKAETALEKPTINLKNTPETKWVQGEKFVSEEFTYECHSGNPIFNVYAKKGKKTYDLNYGYRFEEEGTYTVVYEIKDCAGQTATYEYKLKVKVGDSPVLGEDVELPKYMVEGSEYVFPKVYFNDYRSGKKERKVATGKIVDASGETKVKAGDTYTVSVENNGDPVHIIFECENGSYEVEIPTVKSWGQENGRSVLLVENYFIGTGYIADRNDGITFKATSEEGGWCFANELLAENFKVELQGVSGMTEYESLVLEIRDSEHVEETLAIELPYTQGMLSVKTGEHIQILKKESDLATAGTISIEYTDGVLYVAGTKIKNVDFSGFSTDQVYLSAHFKGAGKNAAFTLLSLNNHTFGTSKTDKVEPQIVIMGTYGGMFEYGSEITLPVAVAGDVLNPNITFFMTVTNGKEVMTDVNGTKLENVDPTKEYTIRADEFGKYNVVYTAYDSFSEKEEKMTYMMHVTDNVAPELEFSRKYKETAKVGDTIFIPSYTVSDNVTAEDALVIMKYVEDPHGVLIPLTDNSNAIVASIPGEYKFVLLVSDEECNVANVSWVVTVEEE